MGQISIVLVAGLIFLFSMNLSQHDAGTEFGWTLALVAGMTFLPALLAYLFGRLVVRDVSPERRISRAFLFRHLLFGFELLVLVLFAVDVYYFHLLALVNRWFADWPMAYTRQILGIVPLIAGMLAIYFAYDEVEARAAGRRWSRWGHLQLRLRLLLLPLLPLFIYLALLDLVQALPLSARLVFIRYPYLSLVLLLLLLIVAYVRAADLLKLIWPASSMPPCELRTRLDALVSRAGIRVRDVLIWYTGDTPIANAAVTGLLPRFRYILITDRLLRSLTPTEIEGVVAHELGHLKHKHIISYLIYSLCYFFGYAGFHHYAQRIYANWGNAEVWNSLFTILFFGFYFVLLFRYLSRRFEHQADLYAVQLTKDPAAFLYALHKLSRTNRTPRAVRRWMELLHTHPSIEQRQQFISRALAEEPRALRYLRTLPATYIIRGLFPLLLLFCSYSVHTLFASPTDIHREVSRQYVLERHYADAIQELEKILKYEPENVEVLYQLALLHYEERDWPDAEERLQQILKTHPQDEAATELLEAVHLRVRVKRVQKEDAQ